MNFNEELKVLNNLFENNRLYGTWEQSEEKLLPDLIDNKLIDLETRMLKSLFEQKKRNFELQQNINNEKKIQQSLRSDVDKMNKTVLDTKEQIKQISLQIIQFDRLNNGISSYQKQDFGRCRSKYGQFAEDYRLKLEKIAEIKNKARFQHKNETKF